MASKISLPVARLRSLGCKVSTIIGHDPSLGELRYGVTLPGGLTIPQGSQARKGRAVARRSESDRRVIVETWDVHTTERDILAQREADVAGLLNDLADRLSKAGG